MLPRLYSPDHDFSRNGYGLLAHCTRCEVTEERNGEYFAELEVLPSDRLVKYIVPGTFIRAKPNHKDKPQLFEVNSAVADKRGVATITVNHIKSYFFNKTLKPLTLNGSEFKFSGTAAEIVETVTSNTQIFPHPHVNVIGFDGTTKTLTQRLDTPYTMGQMFLDDGGIIDKFGGEFYFDDYTVYFYKNRGSATDKVIRYGGNISDYSQTLSNTDLYTTVSAYAKFSDSDHGDIIVESDLRPTGYRVNNDLFFQRNKVIDYSSKFSVVSKDEKDTAGASGFNPKKCDPTTSDGRAQIKEYLNNLVVDYISRKEKKLTQPTANIRVTWQPMLDQLQKVGLCDTVKLIYTPTGLSTRVKAIKTVYNSLAERYKEIEFGEKKLTLKNYLKKSQRR